MSNQFKVFYAHYAKNEFQDAAEATLLPPKKMIPLMQKVLISYPNFWGVIDQNKQSLQFAVLDNFQLLLDIPIPEKQGSLNRVLSLEAAIDIVKNISNPIQINKISNLSFHSWSGESP